MNAVKAYSDERSPLPGLLAVGVCALLAQILLRAWDGTGLWSSTAYSVNASCMYEVFEDRACLGTVFCKQPLTVGDLMRRFGRAEPAKWSGLDQCVPCGSSVRLSSTSSEVFVRTIAGAKLMAAGKKMDLNRAQGSDLSCIPGIGPTLADRIVRERDKRKGFTSIDDLRTIRGIGEKKRQALIQWLDLDHVPINRIRTHHQ